MVLELDIHMQKMGVEWGEDRKREGLSAHRPYNSLHKNSKTKCKMQDYKHLENNTGENLDVPENGGDFLDTIPKI